MNELVLRYNDLPNTIEDLAKFALIGREQLASVRAQIRVIDKLKLADDVRAQKIVEAQYIADAVLDAEVRVGELLKSIPTASGGDRKITDFKKRTDAHFETPKRLMKSLARMNRKVSGLGRSFSFVLTGHFLQSFYLYKAYKQRFCRYRDKLLCLFSVLCNDYVSWF